MSGLLSLDGWALLGYLGQAVFASRFAVQWISSEMRRRSLLPVAFWWLSLAGSTLLLVYALAIRSGPIAIGQAFGLLVYGRNLWLIRRERRAAAAPPRQSA